MHASSSLSRTNPNLNLTMSSYIYDLEKLRHEAAPPRRRYVPPSRGKKPRRRSMDSRRRAIAAIGAATVCLVFVHGGAAARPLVMTRRHPDISEGGLVDTMAADVPPLSEAVMDVSAAAAPEGSVRWEHGDDQMVLGAAKWLPLPVASALASGLRFPGVLPAAGASMPWVVGAPPALAGTGLPLVPPYIGATRQEQLTLWASLFNPFQVRPRLPGAAESSVPAERVPAVASGGLERTTTMDEPAGGVQVGEPKWGVFLGTPNNG